MPLSERARLEMLQAAASSRLRRDFAVMSRNANELAARMSADDLIAFLTALEDFFGLPWSPRPPKPYPRARI